MKVKPYRICDICGEEYQKRSGCMKIKVKKIYSADYIDSINRFESMDICPACGELLIGWIRNRGMLKEATDGPGSICSD